MEKFITTILSSDTITFGALFVFLLWYVLKTTKEREGWLKEHIDRLDNSLTEHVNVLKLMKVELVSKIEAIDDKLERISNSGGDKKGD